jgi:ring-1,2-phenylacetyl-CoA epoxidase subunit PaaB
MSSLDPRINRLGLSDNGAPFLYHSTEGSPYEIFWIAKPGKPYEHVGIVHAGSADLALIYAKEQYSRRGGNCYGLLSVDSAACWASPMLDDDQNVFEELEQVPAEFVGIETVVFGLKKRGKQHFFLGNVKGDTSAELLAAINQLRVAQCVNLWLVAASATAELEAGSESLWNTLPEKQYRDAIHYKSADLIKAFIEGRRSK